MSKPHVVFVITPAYELLEDRLEPPLGILYMATILKNSGFSVNICDLSSVPESKWECMIPDADIYGFSTYTPTVMRTYKLINFIKTRHPNALLVAGGPHASALPNEVKQHVDIVIVGEGELSLLQLVEEYNPDKKINAVIKGEPVDDLNTLPFPDYSLVDLSSYTRILCGEKSVSILSARGCPFECTFCNSRIFQKSKIRMRSAQNIADEMFFLHDKYGVRAFRIQDDTFTLDLERVRKLHSIIKDEGFMYRCFARADHCSKEMVQLLYGSGCRHIAFGVESGSPEILRSMRKGMTREQIFDGIKCAKEAGLRVRIFLIVGYPGETWETIQQTADFVRLCAPHEYIVYPIIPYPGTPLFENPEKFGIVELSTNYSNYFQVYGERKTGYVCSTVQNSSETIKEMREYLINCLDDYASWYRTCHEIT